MRAGDLGRTGDETRDALDKDTELKARIEAIRLIAGPMMNLDDVTTKTVPKMILVSPPRDGGAICTRSFIPHRCHATIGVFAALSVATACLLPEGPARDVVVLPPGRLRRILVEHPTGTAPVLLTVEAERARGGDGRRDHQHRARAVRRPGAGAGERPRGSGAGGR